MLPLFQETWLRPEGTPPVAPRSSRPLSTSRCPPTPRSSARAACSTALTHDLSLPVGTRPPTHESRAPGSSLIHPETPPSWVPQTARGSEAESTLTPSEAGQAPRGSPESGRGGGLGTAPLGEPSPPPGCPGQGASDPQSQRRSRGTCSRWAAWSPAVPSPLGPPHRLACQRPVSSGGPEGGSLVSVGLRAGGQVRAGEGG